jgi:hypothetical protein
VIYLACRILKAKKVDFEKVAEMWEEMLQERNEFGTILSILRN